MTWLSDFSYRKKITITGSTTDDITDYPVKIVVNYGSGSDSGINVYTGSNCKTDFGDIRFTSSDGETELDYYLDQKTDSSKALFWVEVPSISQSPATVDIYVYYGDGTKSTTSSGSNTFTLFEDFENTTFIFDTAGSTGISLTRTSDATAKNGSYTGVNSGSQGYKKQSVSSLTFTTTNHYRVETWAKILSGGGTNEDLGSAVTIFGASGNNNGYEGLLDGRGSVSPQIREAWDYGSRTNGNYQTSEDTWYFLTIHEDSGDIKTTLWTEAQMYGTSPQTTTTRTDSTYTSGYPGIGTYSANHTAWDAWRCRRFIDPEPSITSYSSQEENTTTISPLPTFKRV